MSDSFFSTNFAHTLSLSTPHSSSFSLSTPPPSSLPGVATSPSSPSLSSSSSNPASNTTSSSASTTTTSTNTTTSLGTDTPTAAPQNINTDVITALLQSCVHGRERRWERSISKAQVTEAVRRGRKSSAGYGKYGDHRWKYSWNDVIVITDDASQTEITSWIKHSFGVELPPRATITPAMKRQHQQALVRLHDKTTWTSHTVVVLDQSGSMRNTDTVLHIHANDGNHDCNVHGHRSNEDPFCGGDDQGGASRHEVVWLLLALNLVAKALQTGERTSSDVLSLIGMRHTGDVLLQAQPYDWLLYNRMLDLLEDAESSGHGNYLPSLDCAESLLQLNPYGSCALCLLFLSDGRPSDYWDRGRRFYPGVDFVLQQATRRVARLASDFGRRLTLGAVAIGPPTEDFTVLRHFEGAAREYGAQGVFREATLNAQALSTSITLLTSLVSSTMTEMTSVVGQKRQQVVRKVTREPLSRLGRDLEYDSDRWYSCQLHLRRGTSPTIVRLKWNPYKKNTLRRNFHNNNPHHHHQQRVPMGGWDYETTTFLSPFAAGAAWKRSIFGEGAERIVREFREMDDRGVFVGPPLVAKESRFVGASDDGRVGEKAADPDEEDEQKKAFHRVFCKTQHLAQKVATAFGKALLSLPDVAPETVPSLNFLDCWVYLISHPTLGRHGYLVEQQLDVQNYTYQKWNDNAGRTSQEDKMTLMAPRPMPPQDAGRRVTTAFSVPHAKQESLGAIVEEEEDNDDDDESTEEGDNDDNDDVVEGIPPALYNFHHDENDHDILCSLEDVPQAFSHFSYQFSRRKFLVCDLQGIYHAAQHEFLLTDPVIHYKSSRQRRHVYGRTDKGQAGMEAFFRTHTCSKLCRLLLRKRRPSPHTSPIHVK